MNEPETQLSAEDLMVASALVAKRPAPAPAFRMELGRTLTLWDPGYGHRPAHLWTRAGALVGAGALLVALGALVSIGVI